MAEQAADLQQRKIFNFYRPEDGVRSRAVTGLTVAILLLFGTWSFYQWLPQDWQQPLPKIGTLLGDEFPISAAVLISGAMTIGFMIFTFWMVNYPRFVDFLVETENELKKVSWAAWRQVRNESIVVIATVIVLAVFISAVDFSLIGIKGLPWERFWGWVQGVLS